MILLSMALLPALSTLAQQPALQPAQPPAGSNWQHVQALPPGAEVYVKAKSRHVVCKIKSASAEILTCTERTKDIVFARSEVSSIKITHSGRSALIGLGIGLGAGNAAGFGCRGDWIPGCAVLGGTVLGALGAIIGGVTDFSRSTVYKAP